MRSTYGFTVVCRVSGSTQNVAFSGLLFFYRNVLEMPFEGLSGTLRAKNAPRVPLVLSHDDVAKLINRFADPYRLLSEIYYGCGLRLREGLNLRIQDIDLDRRTVAVVSGKGNKDRVVPLPETLACRVKSRISLSRYLYTFDISNAPAPCGLRYKACPGTSGDDSTTMIYTHMVCPDAKPLRSPLDLLRERENC